MNNLDYKINWLCRTLFLLGIIGGSHFIYLFFKNEINNTKFILALIGVPIGFIALYFSINAKVVVCERGIELCNPWSYFSKKIIWSDVVCIDVWNFIAYKAYAVIPKGWKFGEKTIVLSGIYLRNYKDALREVVLRTNPDTKVDKSILKRVNLTEADIGRNYIPPAKLELSEKRP